MLQINRRRVAGFLLFGLAGCAPRPGSRAVAIRLVDRYKPEQVAGRASGPTESIPRVEWRFDGAAPAAAVKPAATRGWEAGPGVEGLVLREGRLAGRTTTDQPILHVERTSGLEDRDQVKAIEIRARVSAGSELAVSWRDSEKVDLAQVVAQAKGLPWRWKAPITPGNEIQTLTLDEGKIGRGVTNSNIRHLLIQPTNVAGATFEIESVRLVRRKEYLAGIPSGVSWQGLSEIYRETLVARSPESLRFSMTLPKRPLLDLGIGTIEDGPVTFRVAVEHGKQSDVVLDRTLTTPHRWEDAPVDLARYAGQEVTLSLTLASEKPSALGFWGRPVVRDLGAMPAPSAPAKSAAAPPQGVILIWSDTTRRDHLSVYGYQRDTTPVLRRMAAEGTLFRDCIGQATWTKVATPAMMTSLYPLSNGVHDFSDRLPASAVTLAEVFRDAGYATLSMSSILFTGRFTNLHKGFEEVHEDGSLPDRESSKTARVYLDRLFPWLEAHRETPFFVFLHVSDPHDPFKPYPPYDTLWADPAKREEHERQAKEVKKFIQAPLMKLFGMPNREELAKAGFDPDAYVAYDKDWYDGSIRGMDAEFGRLLERLRSLGLDGKTLVVYTGDHGEEFLEHGRMFHGQTAYGELDDVPLLMWGAGVSRGRTVDETVESIDVMPTLLEMARLAVPSAAQGHSFLPLVAPQAVAAGVAEAAPGWPERPAVTEKASTLPGGAPPPNDTESYAIVSGSWKLIHNTKRPQGGPEFELFDHHKDPLDLKDVAAVHRDVVERLARDLAAWQARSESQRLKPDADAKSEMTKEQLDRLRSLGYIQ